MTNPTNTVEEDTRVSFTTTVSFELMYKTVWAWIRGAELKHNNVKLTFNDESTPPSV